MSADPLVTIRAAHVDDAPSIAAIVREVHAMHVAAHPEVFRNPREGPLAPGDIARLVEHAGPLYLVATVDEAVAGYARGELLDEPASAFKHASRVLHVHEMGVAAAHRQRGLGQALMAALRTAAVERGAQGLSLDVYAFNAGARAFYARAGFVPLRHRMVASL